MYGHPVLEAILTTTTGSDDIRAIESFAINLLSMESLYESLKC